MKTGHCAKCPKYNVCAEICATVGAELSRIENGDMRLKKNQHRIEPMYEHQMGRTEHNNYTNMVYGAGVDE